MFGPNLLSVGLDITRRSTGGSVAALSAAAQFAADYATGDAFVMDFTDQSVFISDSGTPANDIDTTEALDFDAFHSVLTYTSPSVKNILHADGELKYAAHNLYLNSAAPANQAVTVVVGIAYKITLTGSTSITLSGAATGTVTAGSTVFTAATTTLTCGSTSGSGTVHLHRHPADETYMATTGTARYARPIEYDAAGEVRGLLVEPAATNLLTYSGDVSNAAWSKDTVSVTLGQATGPDGLQSLSEIRSTLTSGGGGFYYQIKTIGSGATHTLYTFASAGNGDWCALFASNVGSNGVRAWFDLSTGTIGSIGTFGTGWSATSAITDFGGGIYLIQMTITLTGTTIAAGLHPAVTGDLSVGRVLNEYNYFGNHQLELGTVPTSPIITGASTATRAIDNYIKPTSEFAFDGDTYTAYARFSNAVDQGYAKPGIIWFGTSASLYINDTPGKLTNWNTSSAITTGNTVAEPFTNVGVAIAFGASDRAIVLDGDTVVEDAAGSNTSTGFGIGQNAGASGVVHILALASIPERIINDNLQAMTGGVVAAPVITGVPTIAGDEYPGGVLTATPASVTGSPLTTYQWYADGISISGATSITYTLTATEVGSTITVTQTCSNVSGSDSASSIATGVIASSAAVAFANTYATGDAFVMSFEDQSVYIADSGTPANDIDTTEADDYDAFHSVLTYTSPSVKNILHEDGELKYAAHNLATYSLAPCSNYTLSGTTLDATGLSDADGGTLAERVTFSSGGEIQVPNITTVNGASYRIAIYARAADAGGATHTRIATNRAGNWNTGVSEKFALTSSWQLLTVVGDPLPNDALTDMRIVFGTKLADSSADGDCVGSVEFYKVHVHRYPAATDYLATTTAARYSRPTEYDAAGVSRGLLVEPAATNLVLHSNDHTNAAWSNTNSTDARTATGPDGVANSATVITASAGSAAHLVFNTTPIGIVSGTTYTLSKIVESGTHSFPYLGLTNATESFATAVFDLTGSNTSASETDVGTTTGTIVSTKQENLGGGYYRLSITFNIALTAVYGFVGFATAATGNAFTSTGSITFNAAGTETIIVAHSQLELGTVATSPIITGASTVTRVADNLSRATSGFATDVSAATMYVEGTTGNQGYLAKLGLSASTSPGLNISQTTSSRGSGSVRNIPGAAATIASAASATNFNYDGNNKIAVSGGPTSAAVIWNGYVANSQTSVTLDLTGATILHIGSNFDTSTMIGHIKVFAVLPERPDDTTLQDMTT